jgi:hypothetical protein
LGLVLKAIAAFGAVLWMMFKYRLKQLQTLWLELAMPILSLSRAPYSTIRAGRGMRAAHLGATVKAPKQYLRSQPSRHRHLFDD